MKSPRKNQSSSWTPPFSLALVLFALLLFAAPTAQAQIRSGAAYLKILPGTRQQNMAGSLTGSLDGTYSVYANPGATGLLRHWQFSASYNRWIAGISNTSLFYGQGFRLKTFLSEKIHLGLGVNVQSVGNFDATGGSNFVSAQDILLNFSLGFPLTRILPNLSIGTNIKYLMSELAQHSASTAALDIGFVYRTSRKSLDFLFADHFIFSFGAALTQLQLGKPLTFISDETPLPRTFRAGAAVNLGKHDAQQLQLAIDYRKVRDEKKRIGLGVELINPFGRAAWVPELVIRGGHIFEEEHDDRLINSVAVGLSFRLDDYIKTFPYAKKGNHLFLKNAAFRVDGGFLGSTTFDNTYQGSLTYRPTGPEPFEFVSSELMSYDVEKKPGGSCQVCDTVNLTWNATRDPDLYDDVNYLLLITKDDSTALNKYVKLAERNDANLLHDLETPTIQYLRDYDATPGASDSTEIRLLHVPPQNHHSSNGANGSSAPDVVLGSSFFAHRSAKQFSYAIYIPVDAAGDYYWTVLAYDRNRHFRVIGSSEGHISRFRVKGSPQFTIKIKKRPRQNIAEVTLVNTGNDAIDRDFIVRISSFDSTQSRSIVQRALRQPTGELANAGFYRVAGLKPSNPDVIDWNFSPRGNLMDRQIVSDLAAKDSLKFQVEVDENYPYIVAEVDSGNVNCSNARDTLALSDPQLKKVVVVAPFQPRIIFRDVGTFRLTKSAKTELQRLGKAFKSPLLKNVCIKIDGHTDEQGWPGRTPAQNDSLNEDLSLKRVTSVRSYLKSIGVDTSRIVVQGYGRTHPRFPKVDSTFAHLTRARRDSLHRTNRRVEIYLIKHHCPHNTCSINTLSSCPSDTLKIVNPGDQLRYVFTVENKSQFAARNVEIQDLLPEVIQPAINTQSTNGGRYNYSTTIPLLLPNSTKTIELMARVDATIPDTLLELINSAALNTENDINWNNNTSSDTVYVIGGNPPNIEPIATDVRVTGIPRVSETLHGRYTYYDSDHDSEGNSTFRWFRDGRIIPGATSQNYVLRQIDYNHFIRFAVTPVAQTGAMLGRSARSSNLGPIAPNLPPVASSAIITGTPEVGEDLTASFVSFDPETDPLGKELVQWLRDGEPIPGATRETYKLTQQDEGSRISFRVTPVALVGGTRGTPVLSGTTGPIRPSTKIVNIRNVKIKGFPQVRKVLEVIASYDPVEGVQLKYEWWRRKKGGGNFQRIPGQTSKRYELVEGDKGSDLKCKVIAILNGETSTAKFSGKFGPIEPHRVDIFN